MLIFRRTLLLWMFMFWQGGFFFYSSVVVKVGTDLNGQFAQGLITREVTIWMNLAGLIVLLTWLWDLLAERRTRVKRRWAAWLVLLLLLGCLAWLHPQLDAFIDTETYRLRDRADFRALHAWYLHASTAQFVTSIAFTVWTLQNWRSADRESHG